MVLWPERRRRRRPSQPAHLPRRLGLGNELEACSHLIQRHLCHAGCADAERLQRPQRARRISAPSEPRDIFPLATG